MCEWENAFCREKEKQHTQPLPVAKLVDDPGASTPILVHEKKPDVTCRKSLSLTHS